MIFLFNMIVYKIKNRENGKVYIGKYCGENASDRWKQHQRCAKADDSGYLYNALRKYGSESFTLEVLYTAKTLKELSKMETFFIILHQSHKSENGYNLTLGGDGAPPGEFNSMWGKTHTPEARVIMSEATKKMWSESREELIKAQRAGWTTEFRKVASDYRKSHPTALPANLCEPFRETISNLVQSNRLVNAKEVMKIVTPLGFKGSLGDIFEYLFKLRGPKSQYVKQIREVPAFCQNCGRDMPSARDTWDAKNRRFCSRICANRCHFKKVKGAASATAA